MRASSFAFAAIVSLSLVGCTRESGKVARGSAPSAGNSQTLQGKERVVAAAEKRSPRRLESVTWNSVNHQLHWQVSSGKSENGEAYNPVATESYKIDMDRATMTYNGETRRFSGSEARNVRALMEVVSKYAVESTIWWEQGEGEPVDGNGVPLKPRNTKPNQGRLPRNQIANLEDPTRHLEEALLRLSEPR